MVPASLKEYKFASQRAQIGIERILKALESGPMSREELCKALHRSKTGMTHYLLYLRGNASLGWPRRVYIIDWLPARGHYVPAYALGSRPDKREPKRMSDKDRSAARMKKLLADPVAHEQFKARRRELHGSTRPRALSLANRILRYLELSPGRTAREIAIGLDADMRCTVTNLQRLRKTGKAKLYAQPGKKRKMYWHLAVPDVEIGDAARVAVKAWKRPKIEPQGWASALFSAAA